MCALCSRPSLLLWYLFSTACCIVLSVCQRIAYVTLSPFSCAGRSQWTRTERGVSTATLKFRGTDGAVR